MMEEYKLKARALVLSFVMLANYEQAKQCAIICCKEILDVYKNLSEDDDIMFPKEIEFINKVINEIKST